MTMFTTALLATLALTASASPMKRWPNPLDNDATKAGKAYFGTAFQTFYAADTRYSAILDEEFNQYTPENEMKWEVIEPSRGVFNYTGSDLVSRPVCIGDICRLIRLYRSSPRPSRSEVSSEATTLYGTSRRERFYFFTGYGDTDDLAAQLT
jgi:endo-1,4-beta-xylanase